MKKLKRDREIRSPTFNGFSWGLESKSNAFPKSVATFARPLPLSRFLRAVLSTISMILKSNKTKSL